MTKVKIVANEFGICPYCGSNKIDIEETVNDDGLWFDELYQCESCKRLFMQTFSRKDGWLGNDVMDIDEWADAGYNLGKEIDYDDYED